MIDKETNSALSINQQKRLREIDHKLQSLRNRIPDLTEFYNYADRKLNLAKLNIQILEKEEREIRQGQLPLIFDDKF